MDQKKRVATSEKNSLTTATAKIDKKTASKRRHQKNIYNLKVKERNIPVRIG